MPTTVPAPSSVMMFMGRANVVQTMGTANTPAAVLFAAEDVDDGNAHSTSTFTSQFIAPRAGRYLVSAQALFAGGDATTAGTLARLAYLAKNGVRIPGAANWGTYSTTAALMTLPIIPVPVTLAVNDFIQLNVSAGLTGARTAGDNTDGSIMRVDFVG